MFSQSFLPRFSETDALGHISNTAIPVWFEDARTPIFQFFTPELDTQAWKLILAKIDVTFHDELFYGREIEVKTWISRIGGASFDVYQEVWQSDKLCASGTAVMVHFDFVTKSSVKIPDVIREQMQAHIKE